MAEIDYVFQDSQEVERVTQPGTYNVKVIGFEIKQTKGGDPYFRFRLETEDGLQMTSNVIDIPDLNDPDKPKRMDFVLKALDMAEGLTKGSKVRFKEKYFIGRKATVDVVLCKENERGIRYPEVRRWNKYEGNNVSNASHDASQPQALKPVPAKPVNDYWD